MQNLFMVRSPRRKDHSCFDGFYAIISNGPAAYYLLCELLFVFYVDAHDPTLLQNRPRFFRARPVTVLHFTGTGN